MATLKKIFFDMILVSGLPLFDQKIESNRT